MRGKGQGMVEPSFGSDTTRLSTARSLPGNKRADFKWGAGAHFGARVGGQAIVP